MTSARVSMSPNARAGLDLDPVGAQHLPADLAGDDQRLRPDRAVNDAARGDLEKVRRPHLAAQPPSMLSAPRSWLAVDLGALVEDGADLAPSDQASLGARAGIGRGANGFGGAGRRGCQRSPT